MIIPFVGPKKKAMDAWIQMLLSTPIVLSPEEQDADRHWDHFVDEIIRGDNLGLRVGLSTPPFRHDSEPMRNVPDLPIAQVIEEVLRSDDPVAVSLALGRCLREDDGRLRADGLRVAEHWTRIDPDNHLAWLAQASIFNALARWDAACDAMRRGAGATVWREYEVDFCRRAVKAIRNAPFTSFQRFIAVSKVQVLVLSRVADCTVAFLHVASTDRTLRPLVVRLLDAMARDADSPFALASGGMFAASAGMDDDVIASRTRRADAYRQAGSSRSTMHGPDPRGDVEQDAVFERLAHGYEIGARREYAEMLASDGLTEADAARKERDAMDEDSRAMHDQLMIPSPVEYKDEDR